MLTHPRICSQKAKPMWGLMELTLINILFGKEFPLKFSIDIDMQMSFALQIINVLLGEEFPLKL